jgi:predicted DNA-binding ArsR family transcriptional regulator
MTEAVAMELATAQNKVERLWERRSELERLVEGGEKMAYNVQERLKLGYTLEESIELREDELDLNKELIELRSKQGHSLGTAHTV